MKTNDLPLADEHGSAQLSSWMTFLFAAACGLIVANIYYAQPLIGPISAELGLTPAAAGLIVTMTQAGYGLGLLFVVPLGDLVENRKLVLSVVGVGAAALLAAALADGATQFLVAALCIGFGSVAVQILVPFAAHLAPEATRGRTVGNVMTGLMLGIMLARPFASFVTAVASWHAVFYLSTGIMLLLGVVLARALPRREPLVQIHYFELLGSMWQLMRTTPILRRRAFYQACMFGSFSLFWTTTPLLLAGPDFHFTQAGIALFALAGVAGAISAPIAGRFADRGLSRPGTMFAIFSVALAFLLTHVGRPGSTLSLGLLVAAAILLDFGVQASRVFGQRAIFVLGPEYRSRFNGLFMTSFFLAGALCSALGAWIFVHYGWTATAWVGFALPATALAYFAINE